MKYTHAIIIDRSREEVVALFADPGNLRHWQPGLISRELLDGEPGREGARAKLRYRQGRREIEMTETLTRVDLPEGIEVTYQTGGVWNRQHHAFEALPDGRTRWTSASEFRFPSLSMRLLARLMPGAFRQRSVQSMENFKRFAEGRAGAPEEQGGRSS
jgi:uncharacterized membrane protein